MVLKAAQRESSLLGLWWKPDWNLSWNCFPLPLPSDNFLLSKGPGQWLCVFFTPILSGGEDQTLPSAEGETGVYFAHGPRVPAVLCHWGAEWVSSASRGRPGCQRQLWNHHWQAEGACCQGQPSLFCKYCNSGLTYRLATPVNQCVGKWCRS